MASTIACTCNEISLYIQWTATCCSCLCGQCQGCKIQRLDMLKIWNKIIKI